MCVHAFTTLAYISLLEITKRDVQNKLDMPLKNIVSPRKIEVYLCRRVNSKISSSCFRDCLEKSVLIFTCPTGK